MGYQSLEITCPGCGARVTINQKECCFCHQPIVISSFNSLGQINLPTLNKYVSTYKDFLTENPNEPEIIGSLAMCFLKLGRYELAITELENAQKCNPDNSELFFYEAIAILRGKKAFLAKRDDIDKAIECLDAANMIEAKGIYYYLIAYIKYDYFYRKHLNSNPNYYEVLSTANDMGVSEYDICQLFEMLKVELPSDLCL